MSQTIEQCPECFGDLDTGWECNRCGHDARPFKWVVYGAWLRLRWFVKHSIFRKPL